VNESSNFKSSANVVYTMPLQVGALYAIIVTKQKSYSAIR